MDRWPKSMWNKNEIIREIVVKISFKSTASICYNKFSTLIKLKSWDKFQQQPASLLEHYSMKIKKRIKKKRIWWRNQRTICFTSHCFHQIMHWYNCLSVYSAIQFYISIICKGTRKKKAKKMKSSILTNLRSILTREVPFFCKGRLG